MSYTVIALLFLLSAEKPAPTPVPTSAPAPRTLHDIKLKVSRAEAERKLREVDGSAVAPEDTQAPEREETPAAPSRERKRAAAPGTTVPPATGEHLDNAGRGEAYWRSRAARLRSDLTNAETELKLLADAAESYDRANPPGGNGAMQTWARELMRLRNEVDRARTRVAVLKKKQEELAEEARKADAYPGWLR